MTKRVTSGSRWQVPKTEWNLSLVPSQRRHLTLLNRHPWPHGPLVWRLISFLASSSTTGACPNRFPVPITVFPSEAGRQRSNVSD
jgi:hypothetical protein